MVWWISFDIGLGLEAKRESTKMMATNSKKTQKGEPNVRFEPATLSLKCDQQGPRRRGFDRIRALTLLEKKFAPGEGRSAPSSSFSRRAQNCYE